MTLTVGPVDGAQEVDRILAALARGRNEIDFFSQFFLGRTLHPGQLKFVTNAQAKINALACSNRWGKTTEFPVMHFHAGIYKTGAEWRYMNEDGSISMDVFRKLKYETVHTAGEWEQADPVWQDALTLIVQNPRIQAFVAAQPKSKPPYIKGINGWKWMFRTLGTNASNVDGKSIYLLSIDEAGWIDKLDEMMRNVLRVRVADVKGRIVIVGTFKPGVSRDFYKVCVRASAYTGSAIDFAHGQGDDDKDKAPESLDQSIEKYLKQFGIDLSEYRDAMERSRA